MPYIIMLGGGLVFIYDIFPLLAAFCLADRLPEVFANARMKMSDTMLKVISVLGICILLIQASIAFSDIDSIGRIMILGYIILVIAYIYFRTKYNDHAFKNQKTL